MRKERSIDDFVADASALIAAWVAATKNRDGEDGIPLTAYRDDIDWVLQLATYLLFAEYEEAMKTDTLTVELRRRTSAILMMHKAMGH